MQSLSAVVALLVRRASLLVTLVVAAMTLLLGGVAAAQVALHHSNIAAPTTLSKELVTLTGAARPAPAPTPSTAPVGPTPAAAPTPHVVVMGDSVPAGTACQCGGFATDLSSDLSASSTNEAEPGLTSAGLADQLQSPAIVAALRTATLVTITIGANDFDESMASDPACVNLSCYASTMQTFTATMTSILARTRSLVPAGTDIVVTGYWNVFLDGQVGASKGPTYVATSDALTRKLNSALVALSIPTKAVYVDIYTPFKSPAHPDDTALLAADGDHPNSAGHRVIASAIEASVPTSGQ